MASRARYAMAEADHGPRPSGPGATGPLQVDAEADEQEWQEPPSRPEPGSHHLQDPVREGALPGKQQAHEDDDAQHQEDDGDNRADHVRVDADERRA